MKMLFKEFFQLNEMPHLGIATGDFDYELEYFTPKFKSENERIQKFNELKEYIGKLTTPTAKEEGDATVIESPKWKYKFPTTNSNTAAAYNDFVRNDVIITTILNNFGDLIDKSISKDKLYYKKRRKEDIIKYEKWIQEAKAKYPIKAFNEKIKLNF